MIQLFDIKTRTLGFAFCQPPKKSLPKSLTPKKSLQNFKPKKSPQIANFKPKKGLRTSPSLIYLSTPPGVGSFLAERSMPGENLEFLPYFLALLVAKFSNGISRLNRTGALHLKCSRHFIEHGRASIQNWFMVAL